MKGAMDNRHGTALVLIDFSAAFDTVNHNIMIRRLQLRYGFVGKALVWLQSYLEGRTQRVIVRDTSSNTTRVTSGVSQGSVLGPLLFLLYVQPIGDIITAHGLCFHHYADDLQLYFHFDLTATALSATPRHMEYCLNVVNMWMASNCMCMNNNKTEYPPVIPKTAAATALVDGSVIRVGDATITASRFVRNLGVVIDRHLDFKKQVSIIVSVCSFHLRHVNTTSRYLPMATKERGVNAIITLRLDLVSLNRLSVGCGTTPRRQSG